MSGPGMRKRLRPLADELNRLGVEFDVEVRPSGLVRVRLHHCGRHRHITMANSPSKRAMLNTLAQARRTVRQMEDA